MQKYLQAQADAQRCQWRDMLAASGSCIGLLDRVQETTSISTGRTVYQWIRDPSSCAVMCIQAFLRKVVWQKITHQRT